MTLRLLHCVDKRYTGRIHSNARKTCVLNLPEHRAWCGSMVLVWWRALQDECCGWDINEAVFKWHCVTAVHHIACRSCSTLFKLCLQPPSLPCGGALPGGVLWLGQPGAL